MKRDSCQIAVVGVTARSGAAVAASKVEVAVAAASKVEVAVVAASKAAAASKVEVAAVVGKWQKAEIAIEPAGVAAENSLCNCLSLSAENKDAVVKGLGWQVRGWYHHGIDCCKLACLLEFGHVLTSISYNII